jgi:hypothetical protein
LNSDEALALPVARNLRHCPRCGAGIGLSAEVARSPINAALAFLVLSCNYGCPSWRTTVRLDNRRGMEARAAEINKKEGQS